MYNYLPLYTTEIFGPTGPLDKVNQLKITSSFANIGTLSVARTLPLNSFISRRFFGTKQSRTCVFSVRILIPKIVVFKYPRLALLALGGAHPFFHYKPRLLILKRSISISAPPCLSISIRKLNTDNSNSLINQFLNFTPQLSFESLETGYEEIKFSLLGVAGIYRLTNKKNPKRFYIGSTVNLARRIQEYLYLTKGIRTPKSSSELEISIISACNWKLEILKLTTAAQLN